MERPPGVPEAFDVRTVVHLRRREDPSELSEEESTALAHLAHLAELGRRDGGAGQVRGSLDVMPSQVVQPGDGCDLADR